MPLPPGWEGTELAVSMADPMGSRQRYRVVVAGHTVASGETVLVSLYLPETIGRAAPEFFTKLLATVE